LISTVCIPAALYGTEVSVTRASQVTRMDVEVRQLLRDTCQLPRCIPVAILLLEMGIAPLFPMIIKRRVALFRQWVKSVEGGSDSHTSPVITFHSTAPANIKGALSMREANGQFAKSGWLHQSIQIIQRALASMTSHPSITPLELLCGTDATVTDFFRTLVSDAIYLLCWEPRAWKAFRQKPQGGRSLTTRHPSVDEMLPSVRMYMMHRGLLCARRPCGYLTAPAACDLQRTLMCLRAGNTLLNAGFHKHWHPEMMTQREHSCTLCALELRADGEAGPAAAPLEDVNHFLWVCPRLQKERLVLVKLMLQMYDDLEDGQAVQNFARVTDHAQRTRLLLFSNLWLSRQHFARGRRPSRQARNWMWRKRLLVAVHAMFNARTRFLQSCGASSRKPVPRVRPSPMMALPDGDDTRTPTPTVCRRSSRIAGSKVPLVALLSNHDLLVERKSGRRAGVSQRYPTKTVTPG